MPASISHGLKRLLAPARSIPTMPWSARGPAWSWPRPLASLGNTPWTVLAEGIADHSRLGIGGATILIGALVLFGWIPLRQLPGIGTIANVVVIGVSLAVMQPFLPHPGSIPA